MIQANQQTTTIDTWPYYEFEDYINILNKRNEEEKKAREESEKKSHSSSEYRDMMKVANSFKNYSPPNYSMPK